jgi:hypothetical protein
VAILGMQKLSVTPKNLADTSCEPQLSLFLQLFDADLWYQYEAQFTRAQLKI